jgi:hypothetical protein
MDLKSCKHENLQMFLLRYFVPVSRMVSVTSISPPKNFKFSLLKDGMHKSLAFFHFSTQNYCVRQRV